MTQRNILLYSAAGLGLLWLLTRKAGGTVAARSATGALAPSLQLNPTLQKAATNTTTRNQTGNPSLLERLFGSFERMEPASGSSYGITSNAYGSPGSGGGTISGGGIADAISGLFSFVSSNPATTAAAKSGVPFAGAVSQGTRLLSTLIDAISGKSGRQAAAEQNDISWAMLGLGLPESTPPSTYSQKFDSTGAGDMNPEPYNADLSRELAADITAYGERYSTAGVGGYGSLGFAERAAQNYEARELQQRVDDWFQDAPPVSLPSGNEVSDPNPEEY